MGGWYLQPDCNMPSGESIIRQIKSGFNYFSEKFPGSVRPKAAINFDSFGHSRGLVQILNDAGYSGYVAARPDPDAEDRNMVWKGFNDSEVIVYRVPNGYNTLLGQVDKKLEPFILKYSGMETGLFLWGVGNHGGGPSRQDYRLIRDIQDKYPEIEIVHSTPEAYFDEIKSRKKDFSVAGELNYLMQGCYSSMIRIKQLHQKLENELYSAEKMATHTAVCGGRPDWKALERAEEDLLFCEFHDILPGSCIKAAEEDAIVKLSHGIAETEKVKLAAFFQLASGEPKAAPGEYPIIVYNPHPFTVTETLECEFMLADQNWSQEEFFDVELFAKERRLVSQLEKEGSNIPLDWRKRVVFTLEMPPFSVNRVSAYTKLRPVTDKRAIDVRDFFAFDNGDLHAVVSGTTGLIENLSLNGKDYLKQAGAVEIIKNTCDPWGFAYNQHKENLGRFDLLSETEAAKFAGVDSARLCPVRVIEDGEVRTVVEALFGFESSRVAVRYIFPKQGTEIEILLDLYNDLKDVKIKLRLATVFSSAALLGKTAFGRNELPTDCNEVVAQEYVVLTDGCHAVSVQNFGNYGLDSESGNLNLTLLNSSAYSAHPIGDRMIMRDDRFGARIDQGERHFRFVLNFSKSDTRLESVEKESMIKHQPPYVMNYFPTGNGNSCGSFLELTDKAISLVALRPAESDGFVVRLWNSVDAHRETLLDAGFYGVRENICFKPYEFKTFILRRGSLTLVNCLEENKFDTVD